MLRGRIGLGCLSNASLVILGTWITAHHDNTGPEGLHNLRRREVRVRIQQEAVD
jgi:hypothetical protein